MHHSASDREDRHTVVYDGDCPPCRRSAALLRSWDTSHRLRLIPSQAPEVAERFPDVPEREFRAALQIIAPDGRRWAGADAVERALALTPRGRPCARLFRLPLARPVARRVYRWIARHRNVLAWFV